MWYQQDARLTDGIIATALGGRYEDDVRIGSQHQLGIDIALHAYLDNGAILDALADVLVEQVLRTRNALHNVVGIKQGEVGQLQGRHHDGTLDGDHHLLVSFRYSGISLSHQGISVFLPDVYQTDAGRVADGETFGILYGDIGGGICIGMLITIVLTLRLLGTTATKQQDCDTG